MIEVLKSGVNGLIGLIKWIVNTFSTLIQSMQVMSSMLAFAHDYLYLVPGFLAYFCLIFTIIFIVNRILNGHN